MSGFAISGHVTYLAPLLVPGREHLFHAHVGIDDDAPIRHYSASGKDMDCSCWRDSRNRLITDWRCSYEGCITKVGTTQSE